ncbi:hypothetical protein Tsubulata_037193 [Turnera subulata]|uniref:Jasmonate O-methyltransferase n=1 Tax=Turnera subulata TaxID=218843 RepID=A0A9Q0FWD0_9ROSI|nr:hypothetical protein Tsubulata_037193 [Turnera subulata]
MEVEQVLYMKGGEGEYSYYDNSLYQKYVILKTRPILEEAVTKLCLESLQEDCLSMVDMGCSSGPNTLLPLWEIIETIDSTCSKLNQKAPAIQFFLNDLPGNDFDTVFSKLNQKAPAIQFFLNDLPGNDFDTVFRSLLPNFYDKLEKEKFDKLGPCYVAAMPGSFYGRLFPDNSLHFVHSSYGVHFLSQVPEGLVSEFGMPMNKGNICLAKNSPQSVHKAYRDQFEKDFTSFLSSRSSEVISGGRMVLTFAGSSNHNPACIYGTGVWIAICDCLKDMADEGKIEESMLDSFNLPVYHSSAPDVEQLIQREGSFNIARLEEIDVHWDANVEDGNQDLVFDKWARGNYVSSFMRAVTESMLASHFGSGIMDELFHRLFP